MESRSQRRFYRSYRKWEVDKYLYLTTCKAFSVNTSWTVNVREAVMENRMENIFESCVTVAGASSCPHTTEAVSLLSHWVVW